MDLAASPGTLVVCAVAAYLVGSIPVAYLVGRKVAGVDVRDAGEGNVGARNVHHVVGRRWGAVTFLGDAAKGAVVAGAVRGSDTAVLAVAGAAVFAGHAWPVWLRLVGGKGLSTAGGFVTALAPLSALVGAVAAAATWTATRRFLPTTVVIIVATIGVSPLLGVPPATVAVFVGVFVLTGVKRILDHGRMSRIQAANGWDDVRGLSA